jgi:hypothetical protein
VIQLNYVFNVEVSIEMISVVVFATVIRDIMMMAVIIKIANLAIINVTPVESTLFVKLARA